MIPRGPLRPLDPARPPADDLHPLLPEVPPAFAFEDAGAELPREVLVTFPADAPTALREAAIDAVAGTAETIRDAPDGILLRVTPAEGMDAATARDILAGQDGVLFAEPDWTVSIAAISNDPSVLNGSLWGMYGDASARANAFGSQAAEAWAEGRIGATNAVVGVIDTGIDYTHPDLFLNIWLNQKEIPTTLRNQLVDVDGDELITFRDLNASANARHVSDLNRNGRIDAGDLLQDRRWENGIDEDRNGYRDDLIGWDFVNNDNDPFDDRGHGTHVAGTIGAMGGNGLGVAGVAWQVQMVPLKFLAANGSGSTSNAVRAVDYFTGAATRAAPQEDFVATNNSWGGGGHSTALQAAIQRGAAQDILFVAAAGNSATNTDVVANWPSNYQTGGPGQDAVVSVAALTSTGGLAGFSNFGATTVDLAAPGQGILSTLPGGGYGTFSGTSMAAPHVTGAAVLYALENPEASAGDIKTALLGSATSTAALAGRTVTGGRLDIDRLLGEAPPAGRPPVVHETATITRANDDVGATRGALANGARTDDTAPQLIGTLSDPLEAGERLAVYRGGERIGEASWTTGRSGTTWSFTDTTRPGEGTHTWTVRVENAQGGVGTFSGGFTLVIDTGPTLVTGTVRSDTLRGTADADRLVGVPLGDARLGGGTIDRMTGGAGNDIFVLGDARGIFYDDGNRAAPGTADYALITDFRTGDRIQLSDDVGAYWLAPVRLGSVSGLGIHADTNRDFRFDATDELIGVVQGVTRLTSADVIFA